MWGKDTKKQDIPDPPKQNHKDGNIKWLVSIVIIELQTKTTMKYSYLM